MILVIDGQGGKMGGEIIKKIISVFPDIDLAAVGTNSIATENMLKSGAKKAATGENSVLVMAGKADIIIGPIGIVIADALMGEVTPKMALAVGQSKAKRILLPVNKCDTLIAGIESRPISELIDDVIKKVEEVYKLTKI